MSNFYFFNRCDNKKKKILFQMKPFGLDKTIPNTFDMYENEKRYGKCLLLKKLQ